MNHQGLNSLALGDTAGAQDAFETALRLAREGGLLPAALNALAGLAALEVHYKPSPEAAELVFFLLQHPACGQEAKNLAAKLHQELESVFSNGEIEAAEQRAKFRSLDDYVAEQLAGPP